MATKTRPPHIEVVKGLIRWYCRVVATNGQVLLTSEKYSSYPNAWRAAKRLSTTLGLNIKEV